MKVLILGGTKFVGRAVAQDAAERGHEVTLFNRGQGNPDLFPALEHLRGDRDGGLEALSGRRWDVVIDTCGYVPRLVRDSCELLRDATDHYTFISTCSVYADHSQPGQREDAPLAELEDPRVEKVTAETYGGLKVLCEAAVEEVFGDRSLTLRPGLIVGPHDPTDRFTYWPLRVATFDRVIGPPSDAIVEFTDVRDLATFTVDLAQRRFSGIFNVSGPTAEKIVVADFLSECRHAVETPARVMHPTAEFFAEHEVTPWTDLPLWTEPANPGFSTRNIQFAIDEGLSHRHPSETIRDTLAWVRRAHPDSATTWPLKAGLDRAREEDLIAAWESS